MSAQDNPFKWKVTHIYSLSSSLAPQETITCSAEKATYVLDKVEDTYLGVTAELARNHLGNISQFLVGIIFDYKLAVTRHNLWIWAESKGWKKFLGMFQS